MPGMPWYAGAAARRPAQAVSLPHRACVFDQWLAGGYRRIDRFNLVEYRACFGRALTVAPADRRAHARAQRCSIAGADQPPDRYGQAAYPDSAPDRAEPGSVEEHGIVYRPSVGLSPRAPRSLSF